MNGAPAHSASSRIHRLAAHPRVHAAYRWFHLRERAVMQWQRDLVSIPAPPFAEAARAEWLLERFRELGLEQAEIDPEGNVRGWLRASPAAASPENVCVVLSAHIDTVFPADTPIEPALEGRRLKAPGACDNGAGVAGMLAMAAALREARIPLPGDLLLVGNVGEEGDGNLRGMRSLYANPPARIAANLVLDGAGNEAVVTQALGSRRYLVSIDGAGGHSWTDAGAPNPIVAICRAIDSLSRTPLPGSPRTTINVGTIEGGSSVNSIPERATARFDFRSLDAAQLFRLEAELCRAVEDAVLLENHNAFRADALKGKPRPAHSAIELIGDRPAGCIAANAPLLEAVYAVDRLLGIRTQERVASTDANIPLSLGIPALSVGAGGEGGGVHTRGEWYEAVDRELGLKRILLLLLAALSDCASPQ